MIDEIDTNKDKVNLIIKACDFGTCETLLAQLNKIIAQ